MAKYEEETLLNCEYYFKEKGFNIICDGDKKELIFEPQSNNEIIKSLLVKN